MTTEDSTILTTFLNYLFPALITVVFAGIGWAGKAVVEWVKSRTSSEHYALLQMLARQAVAAAEQTLKSKSGAAKKEAAIAAVRGALLAKGIRLDEQAISDAIEAAVYEQTGLKLEDFDAPKAPLGFQPEPEVAAEPAPSGA